MRCQPQQSDIKLMQRVELAEESFDGVIIQTNEWKKGRWLLGDPYGADRRAKRAKLAVTAR